MNKVSHFLITVAPGQFLRNDFRSLLTDDEGLSRVLEGLGVAGE